MVSVICIVVTSCVNIVNEEDESKFHNVLGSGYNKITTFRFMKPGKKYI